MRPTSILPLILVPLCLPGCAKALAKTVEADREVELIIYKQDFGMVRERRSVDLTEGRNRVILQEVSSKLDPDSLLLYLQDGSVASMTFDMGIQSSSELVSRLAGQEVEVMLPSQDGAPGRTLKGILEPSGGGGYLLRSDDRLYINPPGTIIATSRSDVATMPQLSAELDMKRGGEQSMGVAYLTRGLSWGADYVAKMTESDELSLELWATVKNETGTAFQNAKISFVAGSPNRAVEEWEKAKESNMGGAANSSLAETSLIHSSGMGELYAFEAPSAASLGVNQLNRIPMMPPVTVPVTRDYSIALPYQSIYTSGDFDQQGGRLVAQLAISFKNDEQSRLGLPLPAGAVRIYSSESEKSGYIGAASIPDTPKDASVHLTVSKVFDVYGVPKVISTKRLDKKTVRRTLEVRLHNEKKSQVKVRLVQPIDPLGKVASESHKSTKLDQHELQWIITVPSGGEETLTYQLDLKG